MAYFRPTSAGFTFDWNGQTKPLNNMLQGLGLGGGSDPALGGEAVENVDEFLHPGAALFRAILDALRDTALDVVAQDGQADAIQRGLSGRQLLQDFNAEARFLHHALDAAHLPLNSIEPRDQKLLLSNIQHVCICPERVNLQVLRPTRAGVTAPLSRLDEVIRNE